MEYEEWIRAQYRQGLSAEAIAQESLRGPVNSLISNNRVESIFGQVAALLGVAPDAIYVVGSSRFLISPDHQPPVAGSAPRWVDAAVT
ncbi:hypothetical protein LYZ96_23175 [Xanthomonas hortorum pv. vitians]|uniref:hypothetical protein n=1 Tax=Xanthomonas hortorum TaxID=56454 RepID=UPI001F341D0B|nr:hypothetical protein [Xanthomonas hortorum]MCE4291920.1 hypothetical protein [Xanthomonas hortorum pv. vitians]MCE4296228.1 hypothetical protein [Xanthomonas hortorum pv. vitians]